MLCIKDAGWSGREGWAGGGTGETSLDNQPRKTASETSAVWSLCLNKGCKINLNNVCPYREINEGRPILIEGCEYPERENPWLRSSRGRMLGWISIVAVTEARAASAPQTAHTTTPDAKHYGRDKTSREALLRSRFNMTIHGEKKKIFKGHLFRKKLKTSA